MSAGLGRLGRCRLRSAGVWAAWSAGLSGGLATSGLWLTRLGRGRLAAPPLRPAGWPAWVRRVGPVDASFALLRVACLVALGYLAVVLVVGALAQLSGARPLLALSEAISVGVVRRLVRGMLGLGVTAGALATASAPLVAGASPADTVPTLHRVDPPRAGPSPPAADRPDATITMRGAPGAHPTPPTGPAAALPGMRTAEEAPPLTMRSGDTAHATAPLAMRTGDVAHQVTTRAGELARPPLLRTGDPSAIAMRAAATALPPAMHPGPPVEPPAERPGQASPAPAMRAAPAEHAHAPADDSTVPAPPAERVLAAGDHLWSVADEQVAARLGRPGTVDEVADYWRRLVELNRDRLADPANADLVFPGQVIRLPPR